MQLVLRQYNTIQTMWLSISYRWLPRESLQMPLWSSTLSYAEDVCGGHNSSGAGPRPDTLTHSQASKVESTSCLMVWLCMECGMDSQSADILLWITEEEYRGRIQRKTTEEEYRPLGRWCPWLVAAPSAAAAFVWWPSGLSDCSASSLHSRTDSEFAVAFHQESIKYSNS